MSIDEQIAILESEKRAVLKQFEKQINALCLQKQSAATRDSPHPEELVLPSGRRLIQSKGRTLSQIIIEDRGSY